MNLTDDQEDLLRTLVAVYQGGQTSQFVLVTSHGGATLIYPSGPPVPFPYDDVDLHQLAQERFITLSKNSTGELCGKPTKLGIETIIANSGGIEGPQEQTAADGRIGNRGDRRSMVADFVLRCSQETHVDVIEQYIWRAAGHKRPRQFQYWKAGDSKATEADSRNFERILSMNPSDFIELLKKKAIIKS